MREMHVMFFVEMRSRTGHGNKEFAHTDKKQGEL